MPTLDEYTNDLAGYREILTLEDEIVEKKNQ